MGCQQHILNCLVQVTRLQLIYGRGRFQDFAVPVLIAADVKLGCLKKESKDPVNESELHLRINVGVYCEYCPPINWLCSACPVTLP